MLLIISFVPSNHMYTHMWVFFLALVEMHRHTFFFFLSLLCFNIFPSLNNLFLKNLN